MRLTGLDRLLSRVEELEGRRYGLLAHAASVTRDLTPIHLALAGAGYPPWVLFGPEHGFHGVEQDMVAAAAVADPWTGAEIVSLYGDDLASLRPSAEAFRDLDLVVVDIQDVGSRYYTYAATAAWVAEAALAAGREVWVLDRPNPLGGEIIEGNRLQAGFESFVGAFPIPVRHGLTAAELLRLEARRCGWNDDALRYWRLDGWRRGDDWAAIGRPWIAPSPNMPSPETAQIYPGLCLIEATTLSEGRGTTRPFQLVGAPDLDPLAAAERLNALDQAGIRFVPTRFRPQFQKHSGEVCGGVEVVVTDRHELRAYECGVRLVEALHGLLPRGIEWRREPYEFVSDRPAVDLLTGDSRFREGLETGSSSAAWRASWSRDEAEFREQRDSILLYD
jgi:uncharacterized protein YbbC (DUF1343 family)